MKPLAWADEKSEDVKERQDKKKEKKKATITRLNDEEAEAETASPDSSMLSNKMPFFDTSNATSPITKEKCANEINRTNSRDNSNGSTSALINNIFGPMLDPPRYSAAQA